MFQPGGFGNWSMQHGSGQYMQTSTPGYNMGQNSSQQFQQTPQQTKHKTDRPIKGR